MNAPTAKQVRVRPHSRRNKLEKRLRRLVGQAIADFDMIGAGDRVMVCLSGGKDSYGLLDVLLKLRDTAPLDFEIVAVNLDQRHPGYPEHVLPEYLERLGIPFRIAMQDTYSVVKRVIPEGKTMCGLCSRLRRGVLYRVASELGATKIALGHHRDDILETFFLNLFFGGKLKAMPPKLVSDDGKHVVIRPLAYVEEADLEAYRAEARRFPIIPCDLCGSQETLQRKQVKAMLREWEKRHPGRIETIFSALSRIEPSHLLDRRAFDFGAVAATGAASPDGDRAIDFQADFDPPTGRVVIPASVLRLVKLSLSWQSRPYELRRAPRLDLRQPGRGRPPDEARPRGGEQLGQVGLHPVALGGGGRTSQRRPDRRDRHPQRGLRRKTHPGEVARRRRIPFRNSHCRN